MKINYLAVIVPRKWLPQNTEQARAQAWAAVTQLLLPDLGKFYTRFYPASQPWGYDISVPFSVVLGQEDPVTFLNVYHRAKKKLDEAISFHTYGMLGNINLGEMEQIGDVLVCHITVDQKSKALEAHSIWHWAVMEGAFLPDCGLYHLEQKQAFLSLEQERAVSIRPGDYALCAVAMEFELEEDES